MKRLPLILLLASSFSATVVHADELTPKEQYAAESKKAADRFTEDKKLCAEESDSSSRLQCLRDAKADRDKAIQVAKNNLKTAGTVSAVPRATSTAVVAAKEPVQNQACPECGKVVSIQVKEKAGEGGPLGLIAGGVAGALLGNQVGSGRGRDVATLAGAAGGAFVGNKIEKNAKTTKMWEVNVQYNNGSKAVFSFDKEPGFATGDVVINSGNSIVRH